MTKIKLKIKNSGFVILFAVTIAAILLSIALGVSNVTLREIKFGTSAKDTNEAFFAADTGAERVLFNDRSDKSPLTYPLPAPGQISTYESPYIFSGLGSTGNNCAKVTITKDYTAEVPTTTIISKGYNNPDCNTSANTAVERQLEVRY